MPLGKISHRRITLLVRVIASTHTFSDHGGTVLLLVQKSPIGCSYSYEVAGLRASERSCLHGRDHFSKLSPNWPKLQKRASHGQVFGIICEESALLQIVLVLILQVVVLQLLYSVPPSVVLCLVDENLRSDASIEKPCRG